MAASCEETLAGGLWREGRQHRRAVVRDLSAQQAFALLDEADAYLPAERVTALLERAVASVGALTAISADDVRELSVGDRDRLVLAVRRMLHGDRMPCVFSCACGESLELELDVAALLGEEPAAAPRHATAVTPADIELHVRAVNGADQERAARLALTDPRAAAHELLDACVVAANGPDGQRVPVEGEVAELAESLLAGLDPSAELLLAGDCPECGERVTVGFDPIAYVWAELEQWRAQLEHEVHVLALHYHWSEHDIVGLAPARRARYLNQIDHQLALR
jgi:hypothetical protein